MGKETETGKMKKEKIRKLKLKNLWSTVSRLKFFSFTFLEKQHKLWYKDDKMTAD